MKKKITPSELAERLASQAQIEKSQAENFVRKFFELVGNGLLEDKYVKIKSFGTFKLVSVGERESININTGERFQISGHTKVSFTPDSTLKELVNQPFAHFEAVDLNDETDTEELNTVDTALPPELEVEQPDDTDEEDTEEEAGVVDENEEATAAEVPSAPAEEVPQQAQQAPQQTEPESETDLADNEIINLSEPSEPVAPSENSAPSPAVAEEPQTETEQPQTPAVAEEETPAEESTATEESSDGVEETSAEEEEIEVSSPQPVTTPSEDAPLNGHTSSSIAGFVYEEVPSRRKRNAWKYVALAFCALVLMGLCYFAGYFRVLCPECLFTDVPEAPLAPVKEQAKKPQPAAASSAAKSDTAAVAAQANSSHKAEDPQAGASDRQAAPSADHANAAPNASAAAASQPQAQQPASPASKPELQAAPAKPQTVKHTVKAGENLSRIVRRHYGSDAYVNRVVKHNHLKDADNVTVGAVIELPPFN